MERTSGAGYALAELARGDGQPLPSFAVQQHAVVIAFDRGEENVVQCGNAHRTVQAGMTRTPKIRGAGSDQKCTVLRLISAMSKDRK